MTPDAPTLLVHWERTLGDLLDRTQKFPKSVRFTFAARIDAHALDALEKLIEARYARGPRKQEALADVDLALAKLRVLLRLSHDRGFLPRQGFEHLCVSIDEAGRMLGGWRKQQGP